MNKPHFKDFFFILLFPSAAFREQTYINVCQDFLVYFQTYADCRAYCTLSGKAYVHTQQPDGPQVFSSPATPSAGEE